MRRYLYLLVFLGGSSGFAAERLAIEPVVPEGLRMPIQATTAPGSSALFVVEQGGRILKFEELAQSVFLDITSQVVSGGERGLLSIAFHPEFANFESVHRGRFFINYTANRDLQGRPRLHTIVEEYLLTEEGPEAVQEVIRIFQPYGNHNGGQLAFGPDGMLYIGMGDGGGAGDTDGYSQNRQSLLGKMLRLNINVQGEPYGIPEDNPFVGSTSTLEEIYAIGLRNPWRFSFDRKDGRLFAADVGQYRFEEVHIVESGKNYGWNILEGKNCFSPEVGCETKGLEMPLHQYGRADGYSVSGGFVYRGQAIPSLYGAYVFGDFGSGKVWTLRQNLAGAWEAELLFETQLSISAFGETASGEILIVNHRGSIHQVVQSAE